MIGEKPMYDREETNVLSGRKQCMIGKNIIHELNNNYRVISFETHVFIDSDA